METSNVQVSNHIPDDIVFYIISKLPDKSLKRFECVCKSWSLLSDNRDFMTMYRNYFLSKDHSFYDDTSLLLHQSQTIGLTITCYPGGMFPTKFKYDLYSLSGERFENKVKLDWPVRHVRIINCIHDDGQEDKIGFKIVRSISFNGTI